MSDSGNHTKSLNHHFQKMSLDEVVRLREQVTTLSAEVSGLRSEMALRELDTERRIQAAIKDTEARLAVQLSEIAQERKEHDKEHDARIDALEKQSIQDKAKTGGLGALAGAGGGGAIWALLKYVFGIV